MKRSSMRKFEKIAKNARLARHPEALEDTLSKCQNGTTRARLRSRFQRVLRGVALLLLAAGITGCSGKRTVIREAAFPQPMPGPLVITKSEKVLTISPDGRVWDWSGKAEDAVLELLGNTMQLNQEIARLQQALAEATAPKVEASTAPVTAAEAKP